MEQFADKYEELELGIIAATVDIYIIYSVICLLTVGEGGYGKVVKVKNKADPDKVFAAKKVNLAKRDVKTSVKKELEILQKLDSPHVIKFVEYFEDAKARWQFGTKLVVL